MRRDFGKDHLYGVRSEVRPVDAVKEDIAFKRFPRLKRTEKGPDHAAVRINRVRSVIRQREREQQRPKSREWER